MKPPKAKALLASLLPALCAVGLASALAWAAETHRVSQTGRMFQTKEIEIRVGDTVRFTNDDAFLHQIYVRSDQLTFESDEQAPGEAIDIEFPQAGSYQVRCRMHPKMSLLINVR
jgi:plastocyanin